MTFDAEVAVVGLGAWGSATLWRLAQRGVAVVGIERFGLGHAFGSSHGGSRMFRVACLEHPGLVPLAQRSARLWHDLETASGVHLFEPTGGLLIGPENGPVVAGTLAAARAHDLPVRRLDAAELRATHPRHAGVPDDHAAVFERAAGLLRPEAAIRAAVQVATAHGARVLLHTGVHAIRPDQDGVVVRTAAADLRVGQVVVTAGGWLPELLPRFPVEVVRTPTTWFRPEDPAEFSLDRFPVFLRELSGGAALFGHGIDTTGEVKLGMEDRAGSPAVPDADSLDRSVGEPDWAALCGILPGLVPGLGPRPSRAEAGLFTRTPDGQFLLGRVPGSRRVVVGGGCGNHGFKHATGIGEVLADLVLDEAPSVDVAFADPGRFGT